MRDVTVIIPCYNAENYIKKCISSLERQTFDKIEIICIDDCSTDNTLQVLNELKKNCKHNITIIINDNNLGPAESRNKGILLAKTKYIAFCDADDWYDSNFLDIMISTIEENNVNLVFCGYKVINENRKIEYRNIQSAKLINTISESLFLDIDSLCMMVTKTEIMKNNLLPNIRNGEDMAVIPLLIIQAGGIAVVDKCLYNYYRRISSASQMPTMKVVLALEDSYKYVENNISKKYELELEYIGIKNILYAAIITLFGFSFDTRTAKQIINDFEKKHKNWKNNEYIKYLPKYKKIILLLIKYKLFFVIKIIAEIRNKLVGIK